MQGKPVWAARMDRDEDLSESRFGWVRWLMVIGAALVLLIIGLWTQRAPLAEGFIGRELNKLGVQASYDLVSVGARTQRIENIVIGDPAKPDLTARWVEVDLSLAGLSPHVVAVRASGVRMRGSLHDGVLSLGDLDKFRDPDSKDPFAMPDIDMDVRDARMKLATDFGPAGLVLNGSGNLKSGFAGQLAAAMPQADFKGCGLKGALANVKIVMRDGGPAITGPLNAQAFGCRDQRIGYARPRLALDVRGNQALTSWQGNVKLGGDALRVQDLVLAQPGGLIGFDVRDGNANGQLKLNAAVGRYADASGLAPQLNGAWSLTGGASPVMKINAQLAAKNVSSGGRDPLGSLRGSAAGTPVGPLADKLAKALRDISRDNSLGVRFAVQNFNGHTALAVTEAALNGHGGARIALSPDAQFTMTLPDGEWRLDGGLSMGGGGLPEAALRLSPSPSGGLSGQLFVKDYSAPGARMSLEPVRFVAGSNGVTRFATSVKLDGPLGDGDVRALALPVSGEFGHGRFAINRACAPLSLTSLKSGGVALGHTRLTLCPDGGGAMLAYGPGGMSGGAAVRAPVINGTIGGSRLAVKAASAKFALGKPGFTLTDADMQIGPADAPVHLTAASLDGQFAGSALSGVMAGAGGKIGTVPLDISEGQGKWAYRDGVLTVDGALMVADAEAPDRFQPMSVPDFTLRMANSRITADGTLHEPKSGKQVAVAHVVHDLSRNAGSAELLVPELVFNGGLQPENVTLLARGVIANVRGKVEGTGDIAWADGKVTSTGTFSTQGMSLAAAFGPVYGLSTTIHFTDLLGLITAPHQELTIASTNPGVEVTNGVIHYQLVEGQRAHIEDGEWPFSGGRLYLLPTTLDFSAEKPRYLTFRVVGLEAGAFIQTMELDNVSATGLFDGLLPMVFDAQGGRITGGLLVARQQGLAPLILSSAANLDIPCDRTRQAGSLAYVGPVSNEQLGIFGKMAFDALKNLQYKCLSIFMDGALDGELVTRVVFNGVNKSPVGAEAPGGISKQFTGLPFLFNIRIEAPFRGLLNTAASFADPSTLIHNRLGDDYQQKLQNDVAVQPAESETVPKKGP